MILFGWGFQTIKQFGIVFKNLCEHCHNEEYWILARTINWFTLFFIPVFPYKIDYRLSCPVCQYGLSLNREQINDIKPLAIANQQLINGEITNEEHQFRLNQINNKPEQLETEIKKVKELSLNDKNLSYCVGCGTQIVEEIKFCGSCGTAVTVK